MAGIVAALLILVLGGAMAYIRLAPSDPAVWHVNPLVASGEAGHGAKGYVLYPPGVDMTKGAAGGGTFVSMLVFDPDAAKVLASLDRIALATPRTVRLAGSPEEGRITWVTRTAFWGFPDYTTAEVRRDGPTTQLVLYARQRFGSGDFGVNAARLKDWIARLGVE